MASPTFQYIQCDIPEGVSIRQWRHDRTQAPVRRQRRLRSLIGRARRGIRV